LTFITGITIAPDGDVLVVDQTNGLIRINPITGAQTQVAHGGNPSAWFAITGVRVGNNINYYVADSGYSPDNGANYSGQILQIDLSGVQPPKVVAQGIHPCVGTPCLNGDEINHPFGLADDGNGNLIVSDMSSFGGLGAIVRIEQPNTAANPTIDLLWGPSGQNPQWASQAVAYPCPLGVTVQSSGDIIASKFNSNGYGCPNGVTGLFRVGNTNPMDPYNALSNFPGQTDFSINGAGVAWKTPSGLDHDANDDILVADFENFGVYELLKTGGSSFVYNNTCFQFSGTCGPPPVNTFNPVGVSVIRVTPPLGLKGGQTIPTVSCPAVSVPYDGNAHPLVCTASVAGSFSLTYTPSVGASGPVNAGVYSVTGTFTPTDTVNYASANANGSVTINKIAASVTANPAGKTYGGTDPAFTGTLSGFVASDNVTATYGRTAGETVAGNPYTISATLSPAAVLGNYTITYNNANFLISQKAASVTPNPNSKAYGSADPNPLTTGTLSGFLAADNVTATYTRTAGETVAGNPYLISATLSPAAVLGNYSITYNNANFTITPDVAVTITNLAQTSPATLGPLPMPSTVTLVATYTYAAADARTCTVTTDGVVSFAGPGTISESNGTGTCTWTNTFTSDDVYTVTFTITNQNGGVAKGYYKYVVIYNPAAGWVSGYGTINSYPGAYVANPALTGTARFGFSSKYLKNSTVPSGSTGFNLKVAKFKFVGTSQIYLTIAGAKAQYSGSGIAMVHTAAHTGDQDCDDPTHFQAVSTAANFILTAIDGELTGQVSPDGFRIKISDANTKAIIYDNMMGTVDDPNLFTPQTIASGKIEIHKQ
jgi:hypothetical protein